MAVGRAEARYGVYSAPARRLLRRLRTASARLQAETLATEARP